MYSSRLTKSQKHNISICTFRIKDNTFPQQNLLTPTHSLLDNKSEFASLPPRRHLLWGGLSAPCVSTFEETGWEKSFTCGHTHEPRESSHYEPRSVQAERGSRRKAARGYRWLCITSNERCGGNMNMWCAEEELLKMWQLRQAGDRVWSGESSSEWKTSYGLDLDDVQ